MTQNFYQNQLDMLNDGVSTLAQQAINPDLQMQQFQQMMSKAGYDQNPEQTVPKHSLMPTLLGMGIGTAVGALGGYGASDAVLGGISGGLAGYGASNKKRNEYINNIKKKNDDLMKTMMPQFYDISKNSSALNNLINSNKTQTQTQSDMNMGDVFRNNLPPSVVKQPSLLYAGEQPVNPEVENAKNIIKGYGGLEKANQVLKNTQLSEKERNYLQDNINIMSNPPAISGGIVEDNKPLMLAKPKDLETVTMRPLKQEKLKAEVSSTKAQERQRNSAIVKNNASTAHINKSTKLLGTKDSKGGGEKKWQYEEKQKAKLAELSQKWDAGVDAYKSGKITYDQLQKGRNTIRSSYGTIYTGNEKYFRLPSKKINKK